MSDKPDKRFVVSIDVNLTAHEIVDGRQVLYAEDKYHNDTHNQPYYGLVAIQDARLKLVERLKNLGVITAGAIGQGDKLAALGVEDTSPEPIGARQIGPSSPMK